MAGLPLPASDGLFLSYNSVDREAVLKICAALEQRAVTTFLDRTDLRPGLPWVNGLEDALRRVNAVAVFIGPAGMGAWQKREMQYAIDRQAHEEAAGRVFPVIPVLLPHADAGTAPAFLLLNTWIDLRHRLDDSGALDLLAATSRGIQPARPKESVLLCPYRGLQAFREEDAPLFFGRESFAGQLLQRVSEPDLIVVTGPSGSGKSSVVQAGLLPQLRKLRAPTWDAVICTPSNRPFHRIAAALVGIWGMEKSRVDRLLEAEQLGHRLRNGEISLRGAVDLTLAESAGIDRLLLVIDQFEELFTQTLEPERRAFVEALLDAAGSAAVTMILTLRADFFGQAIGLSRGLSDGIQHGLVNVGPMTREELRLAVEQPAAAVGLQFEPGLVDRILDHVEQQPGNLPLLEFALTELFGDGRTRVVTHATYNEIGAVEGAVAKRAETVFARLNQEQQTIALRNLSRLVRVAGANEEGSDTRQRVTQSELDASAQAVLRPFADARLLVTGRNESTQEQTIEVAHEALIRNWTRLGNWVNKDRDFLLWRQRLSLLLSEWERTAKDRGLLLRRAQLTDAVKWLNDREQDLSEREQAFIRESLREDVESSRLPGWAAAREITDPLSRTLALEHVVEALAGSDLEQAKLAAAEALDAGRRIPEDKRSRGLYSAVKALIKAGEIQTALTVARTIADPDDRSAALTRLAEDLVRTGEADQALGVAQELENPYDIGELAAEFAKAGRPHAILSVAHGIADPEKRLNAETRVVEAMAKAGLLDEALVAASEIGDAYTLARLSAPMADAGRVGDLLRAADAVPNLEHRRQTYKYIALECVRIGKVDTLQAEASGTGDASRQSMILAGIAEGLAKAGRHEDAVETARAIPSPDEKSWTLASLAEITARDGKTAEAIALVLNVPVRDRRRAFTWMAETLLKRGKSLELQHALEALPDARTRSDGLSALARAFARTGDIDRALALARQVGDSALFGDLATSSTATGKLPEILEAAGALSARNDRGFAFGAIATELVSAGMVDALQDAAMQITDDRKRSLALAEIAGAVARIGRTEQARAITRVIVDPVAHSEAAALLAAAFVDAGRIDEARHAALETDDSFAIRDVAEALARAGRIDECLQVAARISNIHALADLSDTLASVNRSGDLLSLAGAFPDADDRRAAFQAVAIRCSSLGKLDDLRRAAAGLPGPHLRSLALKEIALEAARTGQTKEALRIAQEIPGPRERTSTLSRVAEGAAQNGDLDDAIALALQIQSRTEQRSTFARIAKACLDLDNSAPLLPALNRIQDAVVRSIGLAGMVDALCDINRHAEAIVLAAAISDESVQHLAYGRCANTCPRAAVDALGKTLEAIADVGVRSVAQSRLMKAMLELGQQHKARLLSATVTDPVARFRLMGVPLTEAGYIPDALQIALAIPNPADRSRAISWILEQFVHIKDTESVIAIARQIDDGSRRSLLLQEISAALRTFSAEAAAIAGRIDEQPAAHRKRTTAAKVGPRSKRPRV